LNQQILNKIYN